MGAQQSSANGADADSAPAAQVKTSYYELLAVERTASEDEIKKAYRRKALELHPDRNYGDVERTTALFADISAAYEVLSDPQERAWYDAHEGDILRGGAGGGGDDHYEYNMKVTTAEDISRLMGKFRSTVEFTDAPTGFFGFVRETFEQLANEEEHAADYEGLRCPEYPSFGHKADEYDDVVRGFYAVWNGFSTVKSFASKDKYRTADAPDRRIRRAMEKENKKFREEGIREFNAAVQNLVAFVRKRDPRYTPNTQTAEDKAKAQREARQQQAARARAANAAKIVDEADAVPEWARARDPEELEEESEEEVEEEHYECVACHKVFKSERQWEAHEKSKKHQKAIYALKKKMQKDDAILRAETGASADPDEDLEEDMEDADADVVDLDDYVDISPASHKPATEPDQDADADSIPDTIPIDPLADKLSSVTLDATNEKADENTTSTSNPHPSTDSQNSDASSDEDATSTVPTISTPAPEDSTPAPPAERKLGAAAKKRLKRAAAQEAAAADPLPHKCARCAASYASKTKLFEHLNASGHAVPVEAAKGAKGKKKGKR